MIVTQEPVSDYSLDLLVDVDAEAAPTKVKVEVSRTGWKTLDLAA
jgi:hypothetical protein